MILTGKAVYYYWGWTDGVKEDKMRPKKLWQTLSLVMIVIAAVLSLVVYGILLGSIFNGFSDELNKAPKSNVIQTGNLPLHNNWQLAFIKSDRVCRM